MDHGSLRPKSFLSEDRWHPILAHLPPDPEASSSPLPLLSAGDEAESLNPAAALAYYADFASATLQNFKRTGCVIFGRCQRTTARETPCNFNTEKKVSRVGSPCPPLGQLLASRILYALLVEEKQYEMARARFYTQSCSKVGQLLVNSSPTPHSMGSCRGLPCSSPLATPEI